MCQNTLPLADDDGREENPGNATLGGTVNSTPWLTVAGMCGALFAVLLGCIHLGQVVRLDRLADLDVHHTLGPASYGFFSAVTQIGNAQIRVLFIALLCAALMWRRHWSGMTFLLAAVAGASLLELLFKVLVNRSRPELFRHVVSAGGSSFPSGHATDTAALCAAVAVLLWDAPPGRFFILPLLALVTLLVGLSRVVLGVHYPSDVIAGYALGCGWVALLVSVDPTVRRLAQRVQALGGGQDWPFYS